MLFPEVKNYYGKLPLYIEGKFIESESEEIIPTMNPAKDEAIAHVPFATKDEVDMAVDAAVRAFEKWKEVPIPTRIQYIYRMKYVIEEHMEEISRVITQNHGKTIDESRGEMRRLIENIETAASIIYTLYKGEHLDNIAVDIDETLVREPLGAFAIVGPFNFPVMAPFWYIPYALALGATVVVKPSEVTPVSMYWLTKVMEKVRLPPGVFNIVHGSRKVVERLIEHPDIRGIAFVGSTPTAKAIYKKAGEEGKRVLLQAGAKNFIIVMPDANFDRTIPNLITSFYGNAGQRCLAGAVLIPVGEAFDKVVPIFVDSARKLKIGYGLDDETELGPVVTKKAKERIIGYIEKGIEEGATLMLDGRNISVPEYPKGYFVGPTVFSDVTPDMTIAKDEIFGPVASIIHTDTLEEAIELANKSNYGNAASIFTSSGRAARKFRREIQVGNVGINIGIAAPMAFFPFGGMKESFYGIVHGQIDCIDFFTDKKIVITRWW